MAELKRHMDVLERVSDIGIAPSGLAPKARN